MLSFVFFTILGSDVVDWLQLHVEGLQERKEAKRYASRMLKEGYIRHTVNKHTFSEQCYYVFADLSDGQSLFPLDSQRLRCDCIFLSCNPGRVVSSPQFYVYDVAFARLCMCILLAVFPIPGMSNMRLGNEQMNTLGYPHHHLPAPPSDSDSIPPLPPPTAHHAPTPTAWAMGAPAPTTPFYAMHHDPMTTPHAGPPSIRAPSIGSLNGPHQHHMGYLMSNPPTVRSEVTRSSELNSTASGGSSKRLLGFFYVVLHGLGLASHADDAKKNYFSFLAYILQ